MARGNKWNTDTFPSLFYGTRMTRPPDGRAGIKQMVADFFNLGSAIIRTICVFPRSIYFGTPMTRILLMVADLNRY